MLEILVYAFSDIIMLLGAAGLAAMHFCGKKSPKDYFGLTKVCLAAALLCGLVFYNKTYAPQYFAGNSYITMIKTVIYALSLAWFFMSYKWFAGKELNGFSYCFIGILLALALGVMSSAANLLSLSGCYIAIFGLMYCFQKVESKECSYEMYAVSAAFVTVVSLLGAVYVSLVAGSGEYGKINEYLQNYQLDIKMFLALSAQILPLLHMLMMFPLHFWNDNLSEKAILPVGGYLMLVPVFAVFSSLSILMHDALMPIYQMLSPVLFSFAVMSMFFGALAAGRENNLRRMFAYSTMYHFGIVLLIMSYMQSFAVLSAFVYLVIYTLAMFGVYAALYAFKNRGEYTETISGIAGTYQVLPYITAAVLIFVLSLLGTPPLLGFLGRFYIVNQLFAGKDYVLILPVLIPLGLLASGYVRLIKAMYFEPRKHNFDRVDSGIYIALFVSIVLVLITLFNTYDVVQVARRIIYGFWEGTV